MHPLKLTLPAVLAVSTFVLGSGCSDDETTTTTSASLPDCSEVVNANECTKCLDGGTVSCEGRGTDPDFACFYDDSRDACDEAIA